jgi:pimeloyl-ACP methyl ester carboxylesterase
MVQELTDATLGDYLHTYTAQALRRQPTPLDVSRPYFMLASNTRPSIFHLMVEPEPGEILEAFVGGSGRPILLLSGFGTTVGQWRRQLVPLARRHQAIALHAPGHGYSVGSRDFSLAGIARSCVKALERLAVDWPVHVVGASWGGMVAQAMARESPECVASLTLAGSMSNALALGTGDLKEMIIADLEQTGSPQDHDVVLNSRFINADLSKYQADAFVTESILPEIMAPTLVLAGERDSIVGTDEARRMSARIPGARYCEIPGAGHVPYVTHAAEFTRLVLAFIDEQEAEIAARGGQREQV